MDWPTDKKEEDETIQQFFSPISLAETILIEFLLRKYINSLYYFKMLMKSIILFIAFSSITCKEMGIGDENMSAKFW